MQIDPLVRVSHICDAADLLGDGTVAGGGGMRWLGPRGAMAAGPAFTLLQRAVTGPAGGSERQLQHRDVALSLAAPGEIIVIQVEGDTVGATWGEAHAMRAHKRGVAGALIDGATRDIDSLAGLGIPILVRGASPFKSTGRLETVALRGEVEISGVRIAQGDFVAIDADGFVRLRAAQAKAILASAAEIARKEAERNVELGVPG